MNKCVICRNDILNEEPALLLDAYEGSKYEICSNCEKQLDIMEANEDIKEAKSAVNYLYTCYLSNGDENVKRVLKNLLDTNSKNIINKEKEQINQNPVDITKGADYFCEIISYEYTDVSKWINILSLTTLIYVILLSIISLSFIFTLAPFGIIVSLVYILGILLFLALIKIIVNMSKEVTQIKKMLINSKNKGI